MKVQKVYATKRRLKNMLRAKIDGRAYKCGQTIKGTEFFVQAIYSKGTVTLQNHYDLTGQARVDYTVKPIDTTNNLG